MLNLSPSDVKALFRIATKDFMKALKDLSLSLYASQYYHKILVVPALFKHSGLRNQVIEYR